MVTPAEAKKAATGKGNADKQAVSHGVAARFGLSPKPPYNAADAIAVALAQAGKEHAKWVLRRARR
jgi:Holliday junction resolvasome RuvABC endonuclease subunit